MDLLCLPNWLTLKAEETENDYLVEAIPLTLQEDCPHCGCGSEMLQRHGVRQQFVTDAPVRGKRVHLYFNRQRYKCLKCNRISQQPLPGIDIRRPITERLIRYIEIETLKKPFLTVADEVGLSATTVRNIFTDFAERMTKSVKFETPQIMGIDEVYIGRIARCIITDISNHRVIDILPKRDMLTVARYLIQIPEKERIEVICMDMWHPFRTVIHKSLPAKIEIVIDTYHVRRMGNQAINAVLGKVREGMSGKKRRECFFDRFILFKRNYSLSQDKKEVLRVWKEKVPEIGTAYELKEEFLEIWSISDRGEAEKRYKQWRERIPSSLEYAFKEIITAIGNWHREIFNYFEYKITNAFTESANNIVKSIQRQGRTYSYEMVRAKMLYGGAFITRRTPPIIKLRSQYSQSQNATRRRKRKKRPPSLQSPNSNVGRLMRARASRDIFTELLRTPPGWDARFQQHLDKIKNSGHQR